MSKKKKGKGKSRLEFPALVQRYKSHDFQGTWQYFKKAKIKPHEQDDARRLWVELTQRFAGEYFENLEFSKALSLTEGLTDGDFPKKGEGLRAAKRVLAGLCRLYLGDWEGAAVDLENAGAQDATGKFAFYYLLALLYGRKFNDPALFGQANVAGWEKQADSRKLYLRFTAHLIAGQWKEALGLLNEMEPLSDLHGANLLVLRYVLSGEAPTGTIDESLIKPLYKALAGLLLRELEITYLKEHSAIGTFIEAKRQHAVHEELSTFLEMLCEEGRPLAETQLDLCLRRLPAEVHPFIVYNQAANLFRENQEENEEAINRIADKYAHLFLQVPESIFLYLRMVTFDAEGHRAGAFFSNLEQYLNRFGASLSNAQLNEIGWLCFDAFLGSSIATKSSYERKRLAQLSEEYRQIIGFKLWLIFDAALYQKNPPWQNKLLDVFTLPNVQDFAVRIEREVDILLQEFHPRQSIFELMLKKFRGEADKKYIQTFELLQKQLLSAAAAQGISTRSKVVLDVLKTLHRHQSKIALEDDFPLPSYMYDDLKNSYRKALDFFGENTAESPWFRDYQALKALPELRSIFEMLQVIPPPANLKSEMAAVLKSGGELPLTDALMRKIHDSHFSIENAGTAALMLASLWDEIPQRAAETVSYFTQAFFKMAASFQCNCHENFYIELLDHLIRHYKSSHYSTLVYQVALAGKDLLVAEEEASYYNTSATVLGAIRQMMKNDNSFLPDTAFVQLLLNFVGAMVKKRKLKTLRKTHNYLKDFFNKKLKDRKLEIE
jgi:hypothetical protein